MIRRILTAVLIAIALASTSAAIPGLLENVVAACDLSSGRGC